MRSSAESTKNNEEGPLFFRQEEVLKSFFEGLTVVKKTEDTIILFGLTNNFSVFFCKMKNNYQLMIYCSVNIKDDNGNS